MSELLKIEVVYALPARQEVFQLSAEPGITALQAIERCGVLTKFPEIAIESAKFGIYGKLVKADAVLRNFDRVEIYRPLIADPKEVRKQRAAAGKAMKKGGGEPE